MKCIEMTGKTTDDAIKNALQELKLTEDKVTVDILEEGSKGFLNIIGVKPARVRVTIKRDRVYEAKNFLREVLESMNMKAEIRVKEENDEIKLT